MTAEQELQMLVNKYGKVEAMLAMKDFISNENDNIQQNDWAALAPRYGLSPNLFNASFSSNGQMFFLKEIKPSNRKYPIIAERDDGKSYKFPVEVIKGFFRGNV
jgi:hypothetical protein